MNKEQTLSIIKPDAILKNHIGEILNIFEQEGLRIVAAKMIQMNVEQAKGFYHVHEKQPFFQDLIKFMTSGPSLILVLSGPNAIQKNREIMGATNPAQAGSHTIRARYGDNIERNAVHGSDSPETAKFEISYFFKESEIFVRP